MCLCCVSVVAGVYQVCGRSAAGVWQACGRVTFGGMVWCRNWPREACYRAAKYV